MYKIIKDDTLNNIQKKEQFQEINILLANNFKKEKKLKLDRTNKKILDSMMLNDFEWWKLIDMLPGNTNMVLIFDNIKYYDNKINTLLVYNNLNNKYSYLNNKLSKHEMYLYGNYLQKLENIFFNHGNTKSYLAVFLGHITFW